MAASGGLLDAVVWLLHGHVFANAMTGNVVLLAIALVSHDYAQVMRHVTPLGAFVLGVSLGKYVLQYHSASALRLALLIEMAGLAIAGAPLHLPSKAVVGLVALTAALQITAFRRLGNVAYNTTFVTGNLRAVFDGAFDMLFPVEPRVQIRKRGRRMFRDLGVICLGFLAGAVLGAWCAPRFGDRSFWIADLLLLAAGLLIRESLAPTV
ncbi:YoaK family protein [Terriglobus aquaticus]|uniref:YoaK family protein n=1 Tax=Terriglobus aquaticus TaxID=940139 RepID=A0ABW9KNE7_9BACT